MIGTISGSDDLYISEIRQGTADALTDGIHIGGAAPESLNIVLKPNGATVECVVKDDKAVTTALRSLWQSKNFRSRDVVLGITHQQIVVREIEVSNLPPKPPRPATTRSADLRVAYDVRLAALDGVEVYGPTPEMARTPTVSFAVAGLPAAEVATRLAGEAVFVSHGDFYATTVVERLGHATDGLVRAGCACYTTSEEVDRLLERGRVDGHRAPFKKVAGRSRWPS